MKGLFFLTLLLASLSLEVYGWGPDGHKITACVGNSFITSTTQSQIQKMLGGNTLADISTWPDNYDHTTAGKWSEKLHFVDLQTDDVKFTYEACVPPSSVPYGCVVTAISNYTEILKKDLQNNYYEQCTNEDDVPCPLSFLTHFLGDSHQPLHVAYQIDVGGNDFDCEYDGSCTQLHSVWDSRLLYTYEDDNDLAWYNVGQQIVSFLSQDKEAIRIITNTTNPAQWGSESFAIARLTPYNLSPATVPAASGWVHNFYQYINGSRTNFISESTNTCSGPNLTYQYYQKTIPVVFHQLARGGLRLAYRLNTIYDPKFDGYLTYNGFQC